MVKHLGILEETLIFFGSLGRQSKASLSTFAPFTSSSCGGEITAVGLIAPTGGLEEEEEGVQWKLRAVVLGNSEETHLCLGCGGRWRHSGDNEGRGRARRGMPQAQLQKARICHLRGLFIFLTHSCCKPVMQPVKPVFNHQAVAEDGFLPQ